MIERWPPVTRLKILLIELGPVNVALSPVRMLNLPKLWNRFPPRVWPT